MALASSLTLLWLAITLGLFGFLLLVQVEEIQVEEIVGRQAIPPLMEVAVVDELQA
jgi:hypothetical protein